MLVLLPLLFLLSASALEDGDTCIGLNNVRGVCKIAYQCSGVVDDLKKKPPIIPPVCAFEGTVPIVCCVEKVWRPFLGPSPTPAPRPQRPPPVTPRRPTTSTTEYTPTQETIIDYEKTATCEPLRNFEVSRKDRRAWKKCLQYQEELVYPCERSKALLGGMVRAKNCKHDFAKLIVGGVDAAQDEFPHMVMLSHSKDPDSLTFGCGGSLISDWFILTAGHCTYQRLVGPVQYAVLNVLKLSRLDPSRVYKVARIIKHPDYNPRFHYNDIALLKTDRQVHLDMFTVPACLYTGREYDDADDSEALTTGWGALWNRGDNSDHLQRVVLKKFTDEECHDNYTKVHDRRLPNGYIPDIQMCYGDKSQSRDACSGDSGGPLQLKMGKVKCMYSIIGVTSFGRKCGIIGLPGMYTRVANYVSWIENEVWPDE